MDNNQFFNRAKPYLAVIFLQFGSAGTGIIVKSALNQGMSHYTFAVYRNAVATAVFAPFAIILERPVIDQNLFYAGMKYTTATFASAMGNILPAITFLMAWILRLEWVDIRKVHSQAKIVGTLVIVSGAMIMTLIEGPSVRFPWTKHKIHEQSTSATNQQDSIKGALMIMSGCFCWACFYILQAITLKSYPVVLSLTSLTCMMGALQGTILTLVVERGNTTIWSIQWDTKLLAALYCGIINSGVMSYVSGTIVKEKGPIFVTVFNPLSMVIIAIMGSFIFAEQMDLGKVLGAVTIVAGLYMVIWGKSKDQSVSKSEESICKSDGDWITPIDQQLNTRDDGKRTSYHESVDGSDAIPPHEAV
ncbi:unnamed protein product [Ilex paraguariensis]|uniref:WAT1-related protein n=1 Tax=Ilex paraguariensis TaxID=185542 RepID=A0ABC8R5P6_9AQUA